MLDWNDTFLNLDHLKASFPGHRVQVKVDDPTVQPKPPFKLTFSDVGAPSGEKRKRDEEEKKETEKEKSIIVEPHVIPNRGPYPYNQPKK